MPNGIPRKGEVLTQISHFWFEKFASLVPNHLLAKADDPLHVPTLQPFAGTKLARQARDDREKGQAARHRMHRARLPLRLRLEGIQEIADRLRHQAARRPAGILGIARTHLHAVHQGRRRPRRKHLLRAGAQNSSATELATQARDLSLKIYKAGRDYARQRGIIIADTKFEFGLFEGKLILIDEVLTPDSSRFWPADQYAPGKGQPSFDKQFVRDYLETLDLEQNPARARHCRTTSSPKPARSIWKPMRS